jgi:hypothetical protein
MYNSETDEMAISGIFPSAVCTRELFMPLAGHQRSEEKPKVVRSIRDAWILLVTCHLSRTPNARRGAVTFSEEDIIKA